MKKLDLIIRPHKLDDIRDSLTAAGIRGITVSEVQGVRSAERQRPRPTWAASTRFSFLPKVHLEVIVEDAKLEQVIAAASEAAVDGSDSGDGKIMVSDVVDVMRIRTGETGESAM